MPVPAPSSSEPDYTIDQKVFSSLIGLCAVGLPTALIIKSVVADCFYDSISHNYYSRFFGDVFVVVLAFIGLFLIAYRGRVGRWDNVLASIAGVAALGVALFPTSGTGLAAEVFCAGRGFFSIQEALPVGPDFLLVPGAEVIHYASASVLFAFLAWYALVIFRRERPGQRDAVTGKLVPEKIIRNRIYLTSGLVILASSFALLAYVRFGEDWAFWNRLNLTFVFEALALYAFGVGWIIKGRAFGKVLLDPTEETAKRSGPA